MHIWTENRVNTIRIPSESHSLRSLRGIQTEPSTLKQRSNEPVQKLHRYDPRHHTGWSHNGQSTSSCKYTVHSIIRTVVFPCHPHAMLDATVSSAALYLPRLGGRITPWEFDTATVTTTRRTAAATVAATRSGRICSGQTERRSRLWRVDKRHPWPYRSRY